MIKKPVQFDHFITKNGAYVDIQYLADHKDVVSIIADWIYDEWFYLYPEMILQDVVSFLRERMNKEQLPLTLVAFEAGEPVGTVSLKMFDMETRGDLSHWLTSLYVAKPWRRRKIGSRLAETAEEKAADLGVCKLFLFTTDASLPGQFYAKLGWIVKETAIYHSYPVIIMEKDLCNKR
ncbi:MAG TPA: GNAT family N-acetyltransferase [Nitrospirota bacterium]|nr:GNAT family N-acetyltransferase [Nitrospirota bacterium]